MNRNAEDRNTKDRPDSAHRPSLWERLTQGAPLAVLLAVVLYILYQLLPVLKLVAVAVLLAVILRTLLKWIQKIVKLRWLAVLVLTGTVGGFVFFLATFVLPSLVQETQQLLTTFPTYLNALITLSIQLHERFRFVPDLSQGLAQFRNVAEQVLGMFPLFLKQILGATVESFATFILALYMAHDPATLIGGVFRLVPSRHHQRLNRLMKTTGIRLRGWILGTGIAILFLGVGTLVGLWALGIPLALSFGVIAALLEVIPYFGSVAGGFLPAMIALTLSPWKFLFVVLLFLVLNQLDAHLVQPLVMGKQVDLHPVVVILVFLMMGKLFGILGVILAVPAAAVLVTLVDEFIPKNSLPSSTGEDA